MNYSDNEHNDSKSRVVAVATKWYYLIGALVWGALAIAMFTSHLWFLDGAQPRAGNYDQYAGWFAVVMAAFNLLRWYWLQKKG